VTAAVICAQELQLPCLLADDLLQGRHLRQYGGGEIGGLGGCGRPNRRVVVGVGGRASERIVCHALHLHRIVAVDQGLLLRGR
jgi:hypothetical protein